MSDAGVGGEGTADRADEELLVVEERMFGEDAGAVARDIDGLG